MDRDDDHYEVGYGKPPKHRQFKPGNRGGGRRKGSLNRLTKILHRLMDANVTVKRGETTTRMKRLEYDYRHLLAKALGGDDAAMGELLEQCRIFGGLRPEPAPEARCGVLVVDYD